MPLQREPWDGVERRQGDAGTGVTSLKIATRAAEGTPLDAEQMFQDSGDPKLNNVRTEDLKDLKLRSKVEALLRTAVIDDLEIAKYVNEFVDANFATALDNLKLGEKPLYDHEKPQEGDVQAPTSQQAKEILASQVTPEQLEVIKKMEKPTLEFIPVTSMARYAEALDSYKPMDGQNDACISDWHKKAFKRADKRDGAKGNTIIGWKIAIEEGVKEPKLLDGDDVNKTLRARNAWFKQEYGKKGVLGADLKRTFILMIESLKNGEPINDYWKQNGTWTFVNEEPEEDGFVSGVDWLDRVRQVRLYGNLAGLQYNLARFRVSVVKDVPRA